MFTQFKTPENYMKVFYKRLVQFDQILFKLSNNLYKTHG